MNEFDNFTLKQRFWNYAKLITGDSYQVDSENKEQLNQIIKILEAGQKGIVLCGKTGSGKTFIFQILQKIFKPPFHPERMQIKHVNEVVAVYEKKGDEGLFSFTHTSICFDELGREKNGKFFGSEQDVMQMLISNRYNMWKTENKISFFTSNYSKNDLAARYGQHSMSRLNEMCEFINIGTLSDYTDRRLTASKIIGFPEVLSRIKTIKMTDTEKKEQVEINRTGFKNISQILTKKNKTT